VSVTHNSDFAYLTRNCFWFLLVILESKTQKRTESKLKVVLLCLAADKFKVKLQASGSTKQEIF
jgi:hypothetical protein